MKNKGAIYAQSDYAGIIRRLLVMGIDLAVVVAILSLAFTLLPHLSLESYFFGSLVFVFIYMIEMKRRVGSIGNLLTGTKLVGISGGRPTLFSMVCRSMFWFMSWLFTIIDIVWIMGDERKQMVRDKFTGIFVVNRKAEPTSYGAIKYSTYMVGGLGLIVKEINESEHTVAHNSKDLSPLA